jgi:hypothetical protein
MKKQQLKSNYLNCSMLSKITDSLPCLQNSFSRKLLRHLYEIGAFKPTQYNNYNPEEDYQFMLDMFNKRSRTMKQEKKATAIILNSIKPFLYEMLQNKVRRSE